MSLDFRIIFFVISLLAAAPILYYYYRRNPTPRFRPSTGEMALVAFFAILICGGLSAFLGGLLQNPDDLRLEEVLTQPPGQFKIEDAEQPERGGLKEKSRAPDGGRRHFIERNSEPAAPRR
ncbi:MAG: hypothetical protein ACR2OZ_04550 [Verrucomicrobiales bacterium]